MSTQTTLLQSRHYNSVETVLTESSNNMMKKPTSGGRIIGTKHQDPLVGSNHNKQSSFFVTREFGDNITNFFNSNDWVPFDNDENGGGDNFFSSACTTRVFPTSPATLTGWACVNPFSPTTNTFGFSNGNKTTATNTRRGTKHKPRNDARFISDENSCAAVQDGVFDLNQHIVSKDVAHAWMSMGDSSNNNSSSNNKNTPSDASLSRVANPSRPLRSGPANHQNKRHCVGGTTTSSSEPTTTQRRPRYCGARRLWRGHEDLHGTTSTPTNQQDSTTCTSNPCRGKTQGHASSGGNHKHRHTTTHNKSHCPTRPRPETPRHSRQGRARRRHRLTMSCEETKSSKTQWRSAKDPKSGRTYYFHLETRETQWRKPMELATHEERQEMQAKEQKQKDFFATMEANILKNISTVILTPVLGKTKTNQPAQPNNKTTTRLCKPSMVRTISSMDENVLRDLTRVPSRRSIGSSSSRRSSVDVESITGSSSRSLGVGDLEPLEVALDPLMEASREMDESSTNFLGTSMSHFGESSIGNFAESSIGNLNDVGFMLSPTPFKDKDGSTLQQELIGEGLIRSGESSPSEDLTFEEIHALAKVAQAAEEMKRVTEPAQVHSAPAGLDLNDSSATVKMENLAKDTNDASPPEPPSTLKPLTDTNQTDSSSLKRLARPKMSKRNTCGTIYVGTTMSAPDKDATIKCVCGVYRAHIVQSQKEEFANFMGPLVESNQYLVFNDFEQERSAAAVNETHVEMQSLSLDHVEKSVPSLDEITGFYRDVFRRSQMETDCIIMSLIYVERLIKDTAGKLRPRVSNWRSILFSCMVLSSKVWDDLSMWNADFSQTCPAGMTVFTLSRINELEIAVLTALKYNVKVKSSEYAKYYFLTRSMIIKSGLGGDDLTSMAPLDVEGAKKLEQVSCNFSHSMHKRPGRLRATKSLDHAARQRIVQAQLDGELSVDKKSPTASIRTDKKGKVSLEHVVNM